MAQAEESKRYNNRAAVAVLTGPSYTEPTYVQYDAVRPRPAASPYYDFTFPGSDEEVGFLSGESDVESHLAPQEDAPSEPCDGEVQCTASPVTNDARRDTDQPSPSGHDGPRPHVPAIVSPGTAAVHSSLSGTTGGTHVGTSGSTVEGGTANGNPLLVLSSDEADPLAGIQDQDTLANGAHEDDDVSGEPYRETAEKEAGSFEVDEGGIRSRVPPLVGQKRSRSVVSSHEGVLPALAL